jgi:hypothetical protein
MRRRRFPRFGTETRRFGDNFADSGVRDGSLGQIRCQERIFLTGAGPYPAPVRYRTALFFVPDMKAMHMTKLLFAIPLVLITSAAAAQQDRQKGHDACARDVSRHCRAQMQEGDQLVLACLKTNRAKISKGCQQMLASHGQ